MSRQGWQTHNKYLLKEEASRAVGGKPVSRSCKNHIILYPERDYFLVNCDAYIVYMNLNYLKMKCIINKLVSFFVSLASPN